MRTGRAGVNDPSQPRQGFVGASAGELTQSVRRCGSKVSEMQSFLQDFQVTVHTAVLLDVADVLPRRSQEPAAVRVSHWLDTNILKQRPNQIQNA